MRFSSDMRRTAMTMFLPRARRLFLARCVAGSNGYFHQEFQNLHVTLGFLQGRTPSIKPMFAEKKAVNSGILAQGVGNSLGKLDHVLRIIQNRKPFAML